MVLVNTQKGNTRLDLALKLDFGFKGRKKLDLFKTFISQPLRNASFIGPEDCEIKVLNRPIFKEQNQAIKNYLLKAILIALGVSMGTLNSKI